MQLKVLCPLPRSTYLPSSWMCCDWQASAVPKCTEGFVWHVVARNTLATTTRAGKGRAVEWLLHSGVFPNGSLWQWRGRAVINRFYWGVPGASPIIPGNPPSCALSQIPLKRVAFLRVFPQDHRPWEPRGGGCECPLRPKEAGVMVRVPHRALVPHRLNHQVCCADVFIWDTRYFFFKHES